MSDAGSWLQERREELHLSRSGVERLTGESANKAADERYRIRRGRLTDLEAGRSAPDIFEVASLCECYKVTLPCCIASLRDEIGRVRKRTGKPHKARCDFKTMVSHPTDWFDRATARLRSRRCWC
jgi:transcriptional regulator with XRE-family HTH domain